MRPCCNWCMECPEPTAIRRWHGSFSAGREKGPALCWCPSSSRSRWSAGCSKSWGTSSRFGWRCSVSGVCRTMCLTGWEAVRARRSARAACAFCFRAFSVRFAASCAILGHCRKRPISSSCCAPSFRSLPPMRPTPTSSWSCRTACPRRRWETSCTTWRCSTRPCLRA